MRRSSRATREQLGAANVPDAHTAGAAAAGRRDERDDEFPAAEQPIVRTPAELMRWRGPQSVGAGPGPATLDGGSDGQQPAAHSTQGRPDARRVFGAFTPAGYSGGGVVGAADVIAPETSVNTRVAEPVGPQAPPVRHRGGATSDDQVRPALFNLATFFRAFDKWTTDVFGSLDKIEMDSPRAGSPYTFGSDVPDREPSPGGGYAAPGIGPNVGASPNSYRLMPRAWDELLINTGGAAAAVTDSARRAGGWRSRG